MRIVVVDPSRVVHRSIAEILAANGHEAMCFSDARAALACVTADETVACVLTSLETSPINGFELCWQLRLLANTPRPLAILVMSSAHGSRSLGEVLDSGADDFMSKPPGREELLARLRAAERLLGLQRELIRQADTDHLTQLLNRGAFLRRANPLAERSPEGTEPAPSITALLIDIDHFKTINDRHGHAIGDAAICGVARVLRETGALSCRWGGEEFAVLIDGLSLDATASMANGIRRRCATLRVATSGEERVSLTVSIGVAARLDGEAIDGVMRRADVALYAAKAGGRDRVSMMSGDAFVDCVG